MAGLVEIVLTLAVGYLLWIAVPVLWRYVSLCRVLKDFSQPGPTHLLWGHMHLDLFSDMRETLEKGRLEANKDKSHKWSVTWLSFVPLIQATHPDSAKAVLKLSDPKPKGRGQTYNIFQQFIGDGLVTSNGKKWERNRKLLTPAFHFDVLRPYVKIYNEAADVLLDKIARQMAITPETMEITDALNLVTLDIILRCALSYEGNIQQQEKHPYATAIQRIGALIMARVRVPWHFLSWTLYMMSANGKEYMKNINYVHEFADKLIAKRKKALTDDPSLLQKRKLDFLDILMTAKDESGRGLTDQDIRDEVDTFMFAGHDTTLAALSWALYNLGKYPEEQDKLFRELCDVTGDRKYIEWEDLARLHRMMLFLKENMRLYSPVMSTTRMLSHQLELDGVIIPAGTSISVSFMALHRNPDIFPDPKEFRPERFLPENVGDRDPYAFVPFSAGPRNCIGQNFSMNEQRVILSRIIKRYKVELDKDHDVIPVPDLIFRPKNGIKVKFVER